MLTGSELHPVTHAQAPLLMKEDRRHERLMLHWRMDVVYETPQGVSEQFHATTNSISKTGCSIFVEQHILVESPVAVQLTIPPLTPEGEGNLIEITALMRYGYLCRARLQYRVGLDFVKFTGDGQRLLEEAFASLRPYG